MTAKTQNLINVGGSLCFYIKADQLLCTLIDHAPHVCRYTAAHRFFYNFTVQFDLIINVIIFKSVTFSSRGS